MSKAIAAAAAAEEAVSRRHLVTAGASGLALAALMTNSQTAKAGGEHEGHGDMKHGSGAMDHGAMHHAGGAKHQALIDTALKCIGRGEVCISHCVATLGTGDTSLKDCLRSVSTMMPMCEALVRLSALEAPRLAEVAKVCMDICADCEKECKKHAEHHAVCKACADSCAECIAECKKVI